MSRLIPSFILTLAFGHIGIGSPLLAQKPKPNIELSGDWSLDLERTTKLLVSQKGKSAAQIVAQIKEMKLQLAEDGNFLWTVGQKSRITGEWSIKKSQKVKQKSSGVIALDPDNLPDHEIMELSFEFLERDIIKMDAPMGMGTIFFKRERKQVDDGIYLIQRWTTNKTELQPLLSGESMFVYRAPKPANETRYLTIESKNGISLSKLKKIVSVKLGDGRTSLQVTLPESSARSLKDISRQHLGREIVIVVNGQSLTTHRIRSTIKHGEIEITRCKDDALKTVLQHLRNR